MVESFKSFVPLRSCELLFLMDKILLTFQKVDEVVASWSGVNLSPFPGIPMHESKEIIIEDKLNEWMGADVGKAQASTSSSSSEAPSTTPRKMSLIGNIPLPIIGTRSSEQANKVY